MSMEQELITKVRALMVARCGRDDVSALREVFDAYDHNKSGCLEPDELSRVLEDAQIGNKLTRGMWVKGILAKLDRSQRNALAWADFEPVLDAA